MDAIKKQKTAVDWLYYELVIRNSDVLKFRQFLEQAKEMEKMQIINTFKEAQVLKVMNDETRAEQYYHNLIKKNDGEI